MTEASPVRNAERMSMDLGRMEGMKSPSELILTPRTSTENGGQLPAVQSAEARHSSGDAPAHPGPDQNMRPIAINITPATPDDHPRLSADHSAADDFFTSEKEPPMRRSSSMGRDTSKGKKMQLMLKNRVHQGQARITTISKKIGHGVVKSGSLRRHNSAPGLFLTNS